MSTIKMPGFTAERAVGNSGRNYVRTSALRRNSSGVEPQARAGGGGVITVGAGDEECEWRCQWRCGRYGCFPTNCYLFCY
jgi:hypothetical protein